MSHTRTIFLLALLVSFLFVNLDYAQAPRTGIVGHVTDAGGAIIQHAKVELEPGTIAATTDDDGNFTISGVAPGSYTLTISNVGFSIFTARVNVQGAAPIRVDAVLKLGTQNESVTVHSDREGGELEALDIERTADNIVQVLPADVITSLPNTNIADALGRMPSVSLERDEGEGKYVQIRGTEPRLSNVTVDGIHLPSPEGVRNVKLDAIPADLVQSVEINKTLSANQDADAIGGSVNLVTRTASNDPYVSLLGMAGYTPITGGRELHQMEGTLGRRFGHDSKFGAVFGFSYDYNARGIDDLEPAPALNLLPSGSIFAGPNTEDLRNYHYDRSRYGFDGELDYRLGDMSSVYLRGLFSRFNDYGEKWAYSPTINNFITSPSDPNNVCGITDVSGVQGCGGMGMRNTFHRPAQELVSVQFGARHPLGKTLLIYELAFSEASYSGGYDTVNYAGPGASDNSVAFGVDTKNPFTPKFPVLNAVNIYDPTAYFLTDANTERDGIFERDVVGDVSLARQYSLKGHSSTVELGFKGWDARKTSLVNRELFNGANGQPMSDFLSDFRDRNYYFGEYTYGPVTEYTKTRAALAPLGTTFDSGTNFPNTFDISERIWAGYVMDTINLGNFRVQGGIRVESTQDDLHAFLVNSDQGTFTSASPLVTTNSYINVFPSIQAQYRLGADTTFRAAYGMGIARANFGDIAPFRLVDPNGSPSVPVSLGNPALKPTHAQNFDVLVERYFNPHGLIEGGFFYKALTDPIYESVLTPITSGQFVGKSQSQPLNGPSAHLAGLELAWQQGLNFLPGALNGMGVRANYSYVTSRASFPVGFDRTDHPTLVRTAPNNWNLDLTYDKKRVSARMGLSHNDANLWAYGSSNAKDPSGDTYLYPHTQVDAQVSYWIPRGHGLQVIVSALNLNNEVFGFYNGAERFPIQREYYSRTISAGLRWTLGGEAP